MCKHLFSPSFIICQWFPNSTRLHLVDWISELVDGEMVRDKLLSVVAWNVWCHMLQKKQNTVCRIYMRWKSFRDLPKYVEVSAIISVVSNQIKSWIFVSTVQFTYACKSILSIYSSDQEILDWPRGLADDLSCMWCANMLLHVHYMTLHAYAQNFGPYPRQSMDYIDDGCYKDLMNDLGFMFAIRQLLRVHEGGLAFFGMPCNSFSFMSKSLHGRTPKNPWGCLCFVFVQQGNILGARMCLLLALCVARGIRFMVENPDRSAIGFFPYLAHLMSFPDLKPERVFWWGPQNLH